MSSKRKFNDFNGHDDGDDGARHKPKAMSRGQSSGFQPQNDPRKMREKMAKRKAIRANRDQPDSMNWIKKRVRTIERRLRSDKSLPANVQNDMERELAHHQQRIKDVAADHERSAMLVKYKMVRFFERRKAERLAKQIRARIEKETDEASQEQLKKDLHTVEIDSIYAQYFPYRERYISLYPASADQDSDKSEGASSAQKFLHAQRPPLWAVIEEAAPKGHKALVQIRERVPSDAPEAAAEGPRSKQAKGEPVTEKDETSSRKSKGGKEKNADKGKKVKDEGAGKDKGKAKTRDAEPDSASDDDDDDNDSDGGFFEAA